MTNTYGPFLLKGIASNGVETEAQCLQVLEQFAQKDYCAVFREIIGDRVVEFRNVNGVVSYEWLTGDAAETVLEVQGYRGWAPYSMFEYLEGIGTVFTPNGTREGEASLSLDTSQPFEMYVLPTRRAISAIWGVIRRLKGQDSEYWATTDEPLELYLELYDSLIRGLEASQKAGVIYRF